MKRYLIDGNNVLCQWKGVARPAPGQEDEFVKLVKNLLTGGDRAIIVFDGPPRQTLRLHAIEVRYSPNEKADAVLIRLIQSHPQPQQLVVVSDDRQVLQAAKTCRRLRAKEFLTKAQNAPTQSEKPDQLTPAQRQHWLKEFGIEDK
jgi:predicted RNA-binding protein with PIN domain